MAALGYFALVVACFSFVANLVMSYKTKGGSIGGVPVLAPPVLHQAPFATLGLFGLSRAANVDLAWWAWPACFVGTAAVGMSAVVWVGRVSSRRRGEEEDRPMVEASPTGSEGGSPMQQIRDILRRVGGEARRLVNAGVTQPGDLALSPTNAGAACNTLAAG